MRLAFWRKGSDRAVAQRALPKPASVAAELIAPSPSGDLDLHALGQTLNRKRGWIIVPTILAFVVSLAVVNTVTPRYKSEARILIDGRENVFLRPSGERNEERAALDPEAVTSQVQLLLSRDLAREIIKKNKLAERQRIRSGAAGVLAGKVAAGIVRYWPRPVLADAGRAGAGSLLRPLHGLRRGQIARHRRRIPVRAIPSLPRASPIRSPKAIWCCSRAPGRSRPGPQASGSRAKSKICARRCPKRNPSVEDFRSKSSLFIGTNNTTLSNQQMGELNTQLNNARALKSDAETKARMIREMLQSGKPIEASEVLNSELIRRLSEQRVTLRAQLAEQSSTLLDNHPRIKELKAQLADLDARCARRRARSRVRSTTTHASPAAGSTG